MRSVSLAVALALVAGCADAPMSPLLQPGAANLATFDGRPPPPWAIIEGSGSAEMPFTYTGYLFINKPGNIAWLKLNAGTNVTFSPNAMLLSVNGEVSGVGTMKVGSTTYQLSSVTSFEASRDCMGGSVSTARGSCGSFEGPGFSSASFTWTGKMANDRNKLIGKPGDDGGWCSEVCYIDTNTGG
jgi:hypothetical protein